MKIRKLLTVVEEIQEDGGRRVEKPIRKVAAIAVIENPFAGRYADDLQELVKTGEELGDLLGRRAVMALGGPVHSYGKAAIVGTDGEYEHAAAILHPTLGTPVPRRSWTAARRSSRPPRSSAGPAPPSTCRSTTRTRPSCAPTSTRWRCG